MCKSEAAILTKDFAKLSNFMWNLPFEGREGDNEWLLKYIIAHLGVWKKSEFHSLYVSHLLDKIIK